jgi:2-keto-3-deoxy-L-rhamnonate aldolase RhmA
MRLNKVKRKLKKGEFVFGTMLKEETEIGTVDVLEMAGFDYFVIDMEHAKYDMVTIGNLLQYARKSEITGIVRIPEINYLYVAKTLDLGAEGIWVPHIDTEEEASSLVRYGKYPPEGKRGAAVPPFRLKEFQSAESPAEYFKSCNEEVLLIAQIESGQAIENIDRISGVKGVDVLMMGTQDLSLDLGFPGQGSHPEMVAAVQKVVDACKKAGIASGNHIAGIDPLRHWMKQGMRMITYTYPSTMLINHAKETLKKLKDGF